MSVKKHIVKATFIILLFSVLGKFFGFAREIIIAAIFGTTSLTDAYFVGLSVPDFFREIISGGVLAAVFIPVYTNFIQKNDRTTSLKFLNTISTSLTILMMLSILVCFPLTPYLVKIFAPELSKSAFLTAVNISKIIFPSIIFMGLASLYGSLLNVHKHFVTPSLTQLLLNIGVIGGAVVLSRKFGIYSLAVGFAAGALMQFLILIPSLTLKEIKFNLIFKWFPEYKSMFVFWAPLFFASIASVGIDLVSRALASGLDSGNIAAINFANRIRETIWLFCGVPLGTAVFPFLSSSYVEKNSEEYSKIVKFAIRLTVFLALPLSAFMAVFSKPIISILFERGAFSSFSTSITSSALMYYSMGALFYALNYIVLRIYFSKQDAVTPLKIFLTGFCLNLVLGFFLRKCLLVGGIALARSITDLFCFLAMIYFLKPIVLNFKMGEVLQNIFQILFISTISLGISYLIYLIFPLPGSLIDKLVIIILTALIAAFLYLFLCRIFKIKEFDSIVNFIKERVAYYRSKTA